MVRLLSPTILVMTVLLAAGCDNRAPDDSAATPSQETYLTVRAGPVPDARVGSLSGTFQVLPASAANGIPSSGLGGACIVFAAADLGFEEMATKRCSTNADCSVPAENPFGYCDNKTKTCWSRPNAPDARTRLCNLGKVFEPSVLNPVPTTPASVVSYSIASGAKARVVACINKKGANPQLTGCGSQVGPDRIEVLGPVATLKD